MKTLTSLLKFRYLFLALTALLTFSCSDDDDQGTPPESQFTITELAASNGNLSTLVAALEQAGLADDLDNPNASFTVLAPTNAAFDALLAELGVTSLTEIDNATLTNVLLNHVLEGEILSSDLTTGYSKTLADGPESTKLSLFTDTSSGIVFNGIASPVANNFDVMASNGVIHVVDAVVTPPTVVDHALANSNFSTLVAAVSRFDDELINILNGSGPFTVFAPTNEAFTNLLAALELNSLDDIDDNTLRTVLLYHVVAGANVTASELSDGQVIETAQGESLTADLSGDPQLVDGSGFNANIIATDVQGSNGVIHAVDKVLLPPSVIEAVLAGASIYDYARLNPNYTTLAAAVDRAGLKEALDDPNASLTVFAPDNAAFEAFLEDNGISSLEDVDSETLSNILRNHVIAGEVLSTGLSTGYVNNLATNADGDALSMYVNLSEGVRINGVSSVVAADIETTNGVIHAVDAVIGLPTIVTFATADPTFETLVAALTREESFTFVDLLSDPSSELAPLTVFAPTNQAFADLLAELGLNSLGDVPTATLESTLLTHVLPNLNVRAEDLTDGAVVTTASEAELTVNLSSSGATLTDQNDRVSNIIATDVQAINGVIHAIDKVVLPPL